MIFRPTQAKDSHLRADPAGGLSRLIWSWFCVSLPWCHAPSRVLRGAQNARKGHIAGLIPRPRRGPASPLSPRRGDFNMYRLRYLDKPRQEDAALWVLIGLCLLAIAVTWRV